MSPRGVVSWYNERDDAYQDFIICVPYYTIDAFWEEVPQEVTWQEALKFWIDGGQIEVWRNDELKYRSRRGYKLGVTKSDERYHFDRKDFTEGKWYIWEGTK